MRAIPSKDGITRSVRSLLVASLLFTSGCASHLIQSAEAEDVGAAGQPFRHVSTSFAGAAGLSSDGTGYVTRDTCRSGDLTKVEFRRSVGQTLVTVLTLGIISPTTIYYYCEKPQPPPPCNCTPTNEL